MKEVAFEISRFTDLIKWVLRNKKERYTDFLNMHSQKVFEKTALNFKDICYTFDGGYASAERKIAIIYPDFMEAQRAPICAVRITWDLSKLSHRDILGSILGLGIKREKIGDIVVREKECDVLLHKDVEGYILINLTKIGNQKVKVYSIDINEIIEPEIKFEDVLSTVASIRLDSVVSSGFRISRSKASELIKSSMVQINWEYTAEPSHEVKEGDVISLRGYGRIKLQEVKGITKKGRISLHILRYL